MPQAPVYDANCKMGVRCHCDIARVNHGKPVKRKLLNHSSKTQAADKPNNTISLVTNVLVFSPGSTLCTKMNQAAKNNANTIDKTVSPKNVTWRNQIKRTNHTPQWVKFSRL